MNNLEQLGKLPPQVKEIEETVLGAIMLERHSYDLVSDVLTADSFYDNRNSKVYEAISQLFNESKPIDLITVVAQLRKNGTLELAGDSHYVANLTTRVNSAANIEIHARIIIEMHMRRQFILFSSEFYNNSYDETKDVFDTSSDMFTKLEKVMELNVRGTFEHVNNTMKATVEKMYLSKDLNITGVPSGMESLDIVTGGWQNQDLIIIAARPAMGKTAFVVSCMVNTAKKGDPVGLFSLEMSTTQLNQRMISSESEIPLERIKHTKQLTDQEWGIIDETSKRISKYPIYIDETPGLSIVEMRSKARRLKKNKGIKLLIVDYLQLMSGTKGTKQSRENEISEISRSLKNIAKELDIPVIALSQLSRAVESRPGDKKPKLSDLRESGSIEQDADIVGFIYRPEYYDIIEDGSGKSLIGKGMVIISKNRQGALGEVLLRFIGKLTKWQDDNEFDNGYLSSLTPIEDALQYQSTESKEAPW